MRLIPRGFFWRTILLILVPLILALTIIANVFFGNHWARVHATLARTLSVEIATIMNFMDSGDMQTAETLAHDIGINATVAPEIHRHAKTTIIHVKQACWPKNLRNA